MKLVLSALLVTVIGFSMQAFAGSRVHEGRGDLDPSGPSFTEFFANHKATYRVSIYETPPLNPRLRKMTLCQEGRVVDGFKQHPVEKYGYIGNLSIVIGNIMINAQASALNSREVDYEVHGSFWPQPSGDGQWQFLFGRAYKTAMLESIGSAGNITERGEPDRYPSLNNDKILSVSVDINPVLTCAQFRKNIER